MSKIQKVVAAVIFGLILSLGAFGADLNSFTTPVAATITSPTPGTKLASGTATFTWTSGTGVSQYILYVGTTPGNDDITYVKTGSVKSATVSVLPTNGGTFYVTLLSYTGSAWIRNGYSYIASGTGTGAVISTPTPGTKLASGPVTFNWNKGVGVSQYILYVGTTPGSDNITYIKTGATQSATVSDLPTNGGKFFITLLSLNGATWIRNGYTYYASGTGTGGVITSPTPGATFSGTSATFKWNRGLGISQYLLYVGTTAGNDNITYVNAGTGTSATVTNLPMDGIPIHVTLLSLNGATWIRTPYTYTAGGAPGVPWFTSTPPTTAQEGVAYSYDVSAMVSAGYTVSYTLTTGPGSLSGQVLTWTPTHSQSRTPNSFTITAKSSAGLTATQSWNISPNGNINGTQILTYVEGSGSTTDVPQDLSSTTISVLLPDGSGGYKTLPGEGTAAGTFTIPNVPAGKYWLDIGGYEFKQLLSSDLVDGYFVGGRPNPDLVAFDGSTLAFSMSGFPSSVTQTCYDWWVPNMRTASDIAVNGDLPCASISRSGDSGPLTGTALLVYLMDASKGDEGYFIANSTNPAYVSPKELRTTSYVFGPDAITTPDKATTTVSGSVVAAESGSTEVAIKRSTFAALGSLVHPATSPTPYQEFAIQPQLFGNKYGRIFFEPLALYYQDQSTDNSDIDLGTISFGMFDPSESLTYTAAYEVPVLVAFPNSEVSGIYAEIATTSSTQFSSGSPASPLVGPVTSPLVDGAAFFENDAISSTPTISWSAPTLGTASYYRVQLFDFYLNDNFYYLRVPVAYFDTMETSMTIPPGVLVPGDVYIFEITAITQPGSDLNNDVLSPPTLNLASADAASGLLTVSGTPTTAGQPAPNLKLVEPAILHKLLAAGFRVTASGMLAPVRPKK